MQTYLRPECYIALRAAIASLALWQLKDALSIDINQTTALTRGGGGGGGGGGGDEKFDGRGSAKSVIE